MRLSIVGLLLFGVVAAVCAALLVASLRASARPPPNARHIEFLVAASDLPRSKILDPNSISAKTVPITEAPEGCMTNTVQVIGKVLAVPMLEGQPFTESCFASETSGYRVASVLPNGMRAVTLSLSDYAGLHGLLYAGCTVDVMTSFKVGRQFVGGTEAMASPLLRGVQVLAVEGETLVSGRTSRDGRTGGRMKKVLVTLMVDVEQAAALQLAMQYGNLSLALRNPMDNMPVPQTQALLSQLTGRELGLMNMQDILKDAASALSALFPRKPEKPPEKPPEPAEKPPEEPKETFWEVTLIRGGDVTTHSVLLPPDGGPGTDPIP